jgi:hypothetical protein
MDLQSLSKMRFGLECVTDGAEILYPAAAQLSLMKRRPWV